MRISRERALRASHANGAGQRGPARERVRGSGGQSPPDENEAFIQSLEARRADLRTRLRQGSGEQAGTDGDSRSAGL
jgi:hypothetical protein